MLRPALPATSRVIQIEDVNGRLALTANTPSVSIRVSLHSDVEAAAKCISAERLLNYIKLLNDPEVSLSLTDKTARLESGDCRMTVPAMDGTISFTVPEENTIQLPQNVLLRALSHVSYAISEEESRPTLRSLLLKASDGKLEVVGTDGHRIGVYTAPFGGVFTLLLPAELCDALSVALADIDEPVEITSDDKTIGIRIVIGEDFHLQVRCSKLTGEYPHYNAVFPAAKRNSVKLGAARLLLGIQRAVAMAPRDSQVVQLAFTADILTLTGADAQAGESVETITHGAALGNECRIGIRGSYLLDALKRLNGEIEVEFGAPSEILQVFASPAEGEFFRYGVMPMMI